MERYAAHDASGDNILQQAERIIVIGSDGMMRAVAYAVRHGLKSYFMEDVKIIGSINSPMQCMMKEICAQCLQKHVFKVDGVMKERYVYSCVNQDQDLDLVDFEHLNARLKQNAVQEKCMRSYFMHLEQTGG
jgi:predicted hydrolase (HD superfamily)